ncbi:MAG: transcriptional regulator [Proteobacteria bacterium]|nr:transcriptional regulator [Pseudomonadota bacterium]
MANINLLSYRDLESLGYGSRVTIWRKVKSGEFPKPLIENVDHARRKWRESDIVEWLESKSEQVV